MGPVKSEKEVEILREGGRKLAAVLERVIEAARPGVSAFELDRLAEKLIREAGGEPSFKGYKTAREVVPYPATLCISVNDEVVHGFPSRKKIIKEGDVVGIDIGMKYKNLFTDMAKTIIVGEGDKEAKRLVEATRKALEIGIAEVRAGNTTGDIGAAIQQYVEGEGFGVVRELIGHGVGYKVHEDPEIPNWGTRGKGAKLEKGMVIAIEPMVTEGSHGVYLAEDDWTWKTKDGKRAAHFEHTVAVTRDGAEVLTKL